MRLLRSFPVAAFALVLLAIVSFCAAKNQVGFLLVTGAIAAASWYVAEGPRGLALPRWASNLLIILASIAVVPDIILHPTDAPGVLGRFAVYLCLIKLYERKTCRDYAQLLWLTLVLVVAGALSSRDLLFGVAVFFYTVLGVYVLLLYQIHAAQERAVIARRIESPPGHRLVPSVRPVIGRDVTGQFALTVLGACLLGLAVSTLVFLSVPRGVGAGWLRRILPDPARERGGVLGQVSLTTGSRITESRTPIFRVRVLSPSGEPVEYPGPLYLKANALDLYDSAQFTWLASPQPVAERNEPQTVGPAGFTPVADFSRLGAVPLESCYTLEFESLAPLDFAVLSIVAPIALSTDSDRAFTFNPRTGSIYLQGLTPPRGYRVKADPRPSDAVLRALNGRASVAMRSTLYDDDRVRREAERLIRAAGLPLNAPVSYPERGEHNRRVARAFEEHLQRQFTYTLDLSDVDIEGDPIPSFLLDFRRGHCEYFASALVAMCQTVGVEARIVTGYLGSDYEGNGWYTVRESNAHAWAEVRTGPFAWTAFDPTPPQTLERLLNPPSTMADQVRNVYEFLEVGWLANVVNFDASAQSAVADTMRLDALEAINRFTEQAVEWLRRFVSRFGFAGGLWILAVSAAVFVAGLVAVKLVRRARRLRRTLHLEHLKRSEYRRLLRQLGFYLDMLDVLRRAGLAKPAWQPPLAYADAIQARRPEVADPVRSLTRVFYAARYGGRTLTTDESTLAREALTRLAQRLSVRLP